MDANYDFSSLFMKSQSTSDSSHFQHTNKYRTPPDPSPELSHKKLSI